MLRLRTMVWLIGSCTDCIFLIIFFDKLYHSRAFKTVILLFGITGF